MAQDAIDRAVVEGGLKADACSTAQLKLIGSGGCAPRLLGGSWVASLLTRSVRRGGQARRSLALRCLPTACACRLSSPRSAEGYHPALFTEIAEN